MNPVLIDLGFIKIYWYSVTILTALLVGYSLVINEAKRFKIPKDYLQNLIFYTVIFSILGARLYYVLFNWSYYSKNIIEIFKVWNGGLAIHGGIIAGLITILVYTKKYKVNTWKIFDISAVALIVGQAIGRWGNFFNSEAHGPKTTLEFLQNLRLPQFIIDGMNIGGIYYHPTFLYESLWCLIGFFILLVIRRRKFCKTGQIAGIYFIWYGIGRLLIESLRTDSLMLGNFKIAQIISLILIIVGIIIIIIKNNLKSNSYYNDLEDTNEIRF